MAPQICPHCRFSNAPGAVFCGNCGQALAAEQKRPPGVNKPRAAGRGGRAAYFLLPLAVVAGLAFLAAVALFLLPRLGVDMPPALAGLLGGAAPTGVETAEPTAAPPSRAAGGEGEATTVAELSPTAATSVDMAVTLSPTLTLFPTDTPQPTFTPALTATPPPSPSPTAIPLPSPTSIIAPTSAPAACQFSPGDRWGSTLWARYQDELGCATTGEITSNAAYQYYEHGLMVWREAPDLVYVLYYDGTFAGFPAAGPAGYFDSEWLKGSFGYLWNNNAAVRSQVGQPQAAEFNATDFAAQDFARGTIFYFLENDAQNYVLFNNSGTWTSAQE